MNLRHSPSHGGSAAERIFSILRRGPVTLVELRARASISRQTIRYALNELRASDLVEEVEKYDGKRAYRARRES